MFKANNNLSVHRFAWFIRNYMTPEIAAKINCAGLMLISSIGDGAKVNTLLDAMPKSLHESALSIFYRLDPANYGQFVEEMCRHTLNGYDTEDNDSLGGFSQRELDLIMTFFGEV